MGTWRPITFGNLLRLFTNILARRITSEAPVNDIQRGFVPCDGTENVLFARCLKEGSTKSDVTAIVVLRPGFRLCWTKAYIRCSGPLGGDVQGNPASTELFKAAIDPLICNLQESGDGVTLRRAPKKLGCLGFADDVIVLVESVERMARLLAIVSRLLLRLWLEAQCVEVQAVAAKAR
ncbi:retrovirus-related Pol polyprotein from type-1 retrotransposable element R2 [Caerostris darwini]|uniref:Retrovirus-related Pol polyprotein from type-1 retrotransposable element R2 n=1 Tax=Caerostris darwini TaxID=1538125 RepID=A0AAV4UAQ1_9ARAC|nr:retrovirus-related Pol polyprotein from type-1 retrotransposable element R2 [Caerostris darwini]